MFLFVGSLCFREVRVSHQPAVPQTSSHHSTPHTGKSTPGPNNIYVGIYLCCVDVCITSVSLFPAECNAR